MRRVVVVLLAAGAAVVVIGLAVFSGVLTSDSSGLAVFAPLQPVRVQLTSRGTSYEIELRKDDRGSLWCMSVRDLAANGGAGPCFTRADQAAFVMQRGEGDARELYGAGVAPRGAASVELEFCHAPPVAGQLLPVTGTDRSFFYVVSDVQAAMADGLFHEPTVTVKDAQGRTLIAGTMAVGQTGPCG